MVRAILVALAVVVAGASSFIIVRLQAWHADTAASVASIEPSPARSGRSVDLSANEAVPAPVRRFFARTLREGQPLIVSARVTQQAEFFIGGAWRPLSATQEFAVSPPGFVWDAGITMMPLVTVHVRDAYVVGRGAMQATFFGVYSLADEVDKPELNAGALQRFLGEAIWLPTALLPSEAVRWTPLDDDSATVTLSDRGNTVSLDYHFEQDGRISTITGLRYKESSGHYTLQPWRIQCSDHAIRDGMTIPLSCEVAWINEGRAEPYWRGRLTSVSYRYN